MKSDDIKAGLPSYKFGTDLQKNESKKSIDKLLSGKIVLDKPSFAKLNQPNLTHDLNQARQNLQKLSKQDINFINTNVIKLPDPNDKSLVLKVLNVISKSANRQLSLNFNKINSNLPQKSAGNVINFIKLLEQINSKDQSFKDSTNANWRLAIIPWIDTNKDCNISLLKLIVRDKDEKKQKTSKLENSGSRFIFELEFAGIGPLILDCLYFEDKKTILLLVKTINNLGKDEKNELISKFVEPLVAIGWFGRINFIVEKNMQSILFIKKDNNGMII